MKSPDLSIFCIIQRLMFRGSKKCAYFCTLIDNMVLSFMKKSIGLLPLVLCLLCMVSACKDEDETVLSTDCYIHSFALGNVTRQVNTKTEAGKDTTYYITYNASYYPMRVNQLEGKIANKDSLPYNSRVNAVLATLEYSGTVVYRKVEEEGTWHSYSSSDSIDFSNPLVFRVYSQDYTAWRDYLVEVNIHRQNGDEFVWRKVAEPGLWDEADSLKAMVWNGRLWVFSSKGGNRRAFSASLPDGIDWTEQTVSGCETADVTTLVVWNEKLYMSQADGTLLRSEDGLEWHTVQAGRPLRLLAADETGIYAMWDGKIFRSTDGMAWTEEALDEDPALLPSRDVAAVAYVQGNGMRRILLGGNRSATDYPSDEWAMLWSRSTPAADEPSHWAYFNVSPDNAYACPRLERLNMVRYDEVVLAFGGASLGDDAHEPLDAFYVSEDNGVTWKADGVYVLPEELCGQEVPVASVVESGSRLWIVAGRQVWRGQLARLGFADR